MKKTILIPVMAITVALSSCSGYYNKDLVGTWDAGKATLDKNMTVTIRDDGTVTAEIKDLGMRSLKGRYTLDGNRIVFKLSVFDLAYKITRLDKEVLVMSNKWARVTWHRIQ